MGVIGTITDGIKDGWDAVNAAKFSKNSRYLAAGEIRIAQNVFLDTVPYDRVYIADGLGFQGREYTLPVPGTSPREYVIHAGDGYYGMSKLKEDQKTLIHELTHVWQGQHTTWAWSYVFSSAWHQAGNSNAAYAYDKDNLKPWDDYNPEQQAKIVEDWFGDGMNTDDERYRYIVVNIRGQMFVPATDDPGVGTSQSVSKDSPPPPITERGSASCKRSSPPRTRPRRWASTTGCG